MKNNSTPDSAVSEILVLGGGSAGFLAALTLKSRFPELKVKVLHSSSIPIIGVGEGTTFTMPLFLHGYLKIDPADFHRAVRPTYKLGIRFLWGPRERFHYSFTNQLDARVRELPKPNGYYAYPDFDYADITGALMAHGKAFERQDDGGPLVPTSVAYHIENEPFVAYLEAHARRMGVEIQDDTVESVEEDDEGIRALVLKSGERVSADLYVDCSGFRGELIRKTLEEPLEDFGSSLFCDRALAGAWERTDEPVQPFTTAETMNAGWCWRIEHDHKINRGYVYASGFISDEEAEREYREKNPRAGDVRLIKFGSGCTQRAWVKNVVALGNSNGFVEPLEATALAVICDHAAKLVQSLAATDFRVEPKSREFFNRYARRNWDGIRRFLAMHYKFNTRLETEFWKTCRSDTDLAGAEDIVDYYRQCGPGLLWAGEAMGPSDPFGWEGYLAMLVGQKVPYENPHRPSDRERDIWQTFQANLERRARNGLTVEEALDIIRSGQWQWRPDFYTSASRW